MRRVSSWKVFRAAGARSASEEAVEQAHDHAGPGSKFAAAAIDLYFQAFMAGVRFADDRGEAGR